MSLDSAHVDADNVQTDTLLLIFGDFKVETQDYGGCGGYSGLRFYKSLDSEWFAYFTNSPPKWRLNVCKCLRTDKTTTLTWVLKIILCMNLARTTFIYHLFNRCNAISHFVWWAHTSWPMRKTDNNETHHNAHAWTKGGVERGMGGGDRGAYWKSIEVHEAAVGGNVFE